MHTHLNQNGVKDSCGMWRTVDGVKWPHWTTEYRPGLVAYYRRAGVRCKRFGVEIFVHPDDQAAARLVDDAPREG